MYQKNVFNLGGYVGKILLVDLERKDFQEEPLSEVDAIKLVGGYGIGAKFLYYHQQAGADPLGPDNWLGFTTGPLTGSTIPTGTRWTVVTKSPLTGTWGDANAGGWFGQRLKASGYDAVFFRGVSPKPIYVFIDQGNISFHDASDLWGLDTYETEDRLVERHGEGIQVACIGPAGESLSLISGIVHSKGRVAARSGVGAVMGSKHLKAVVVCGSLPLPLGNATKSIKNVYVKQILDGIGSSEFYRTTGTAGAIVNCLTTADSPIRNWSGVPDDFPNVKEIGVHVVFKNGRKKRTCWGCPMACWGEVGLNGELVAQPEYESAAAFGSIQLVSDIKSILKSNDLCNRYGLDTISTGGTIAFAMECYENGLVNQEDIGFPLSWGDGQAALQLVEQMAYRRGFGAVLADGSMQAAKKIGGEAENYAIHIRGQELPMHDPRLEPGLGLSYIADATPGRHNQANCFIPAVGMDIGLKGFAEDVGNQVGRGNFLKPLMCLFHVLQAAGGCQFGFLSTKVDFLQDSLSAVTGHEYSYEEVLLCGERIANLRQAFNIRENINLVDTHIPLRAYGHPPLERGPNAGVEVKLDIMLKEYLEDMEWDSTTAIPSDKKLQKLGLDWLINDMRNVRMKTRKRYDLD